MTETYTARTGVLLVNLGSPVSTKTADVRRFLREFLGDPRVVNLPRPLWWMILHLFILPLRPHKSAHAYRSIWTEQGSPLAVFTRQLTEKLASSSLTEDLLIDYAMRYGKPGISEKLLMFKEQGIEDVLILPLYPQYSSTTSASIFDVVAETLCGWRHIPGLRFISDYHRNPAYIAAVADSIQQFWQSEGRGEMLLMSFHGLPAKLTELGDPYYHQCRMTAQLIAEKLKLDEQQWTLVFQSRFGRAEWLKPYCLETLRSLPEKGVRKIDVVCPGFAVDCLETLEEIALTNKEIFIEAGGEQYRYIAALNDSDAHVDLLAKLIKSSV